MHDGRPSLLLHCPWRGGTGLVFVDYRLRLPQARPIRLELGLAMRHDIVGKSDGATFSVSLTCDGRTDEFVRKHYALAQPREFDFDLTPHAGKSIVLRLQTEPGQRKDPSFDFSRFVEPRLIAGKVGDVRSRLVAEMTGTKAYRALREADLTKLANRSGLRILPPCKVEHRNSITKNGDACEFLYEGEDCRIVCTYGSHWQRCGASRPAASPASISKAWTT